ncbi:MAG: hypothetical protein HY782_08220 [Chloroflexi bacterium]|nr:hypothetical protein [Chloroflexota bacterium]
MKNVLSLAFFTLMLALAVLLAACSGAPAAATNPLDKPGSRLDTSYANALNARTLLLLGAVRLEEGSGPAVTKEQAAKLIPLWQASKSLSASGTASQAEIDAVTNQILAAMTPEQIQAINAMRLTQTDMQAFNQTLGITAPSSVPSGAVPGQGQVPGSVPGQGQSLSAAERATRQAEFGGTGSSTASIDYLIGILQRKAGT